MKSKLIIRNTEPLLESAKRVERGEDSFVNFSSESFELTAYNVPPPLGFHFPAKYPYCCDYHTKMFSLAQQAYETFPTCCGPHQRLLETNWFNKVDYIYAPFKTVSLVSYLHFILYDFRYHPNWRIEFADYIDDCLRSFGQLPDGYGPPPGRSQFISVSVAMIEEIDFLRQDQQEMLLKYLEPDRTELPEPTDLNLLHKIYKDWLTLFPFDLPMFQHLKEKFQKNMPLIKGPGHTNRYTGLTCFQLKTRQELKDLLIGMTRMLLNELNSLKLYEEGILLQPDKVRLDMALHQRRLRLEEDALTPVTDKTDFIRLLDKWYNDEKDFLSDVAADVQKNSRMQFIDDILEGMKALQDNGINEHCIKNVRDKGANKESYFRYFFRNWLRARLRDATVTAEEEQGNGYVDLRILRRGAPDRIIEFKGWWNEDKLTTPAQLCRYLTDFEREGFIFMINHLQKKSIDEGYKAIVTSPSMNYVANSWEAHSHRGTGVPFYVSRHQFDGKEKIIYHFIFNVYF